MGQQDTLDIIRHETYSDTTFNKAGSPDSEHVARLDLTLTVSAAYDYKWVQVVAKDVPRKVDGSVTTGTDTFYDGTKRGRRHHPVNYPYYYTRYQDGLYSVPPEILFTDQPQTSSRTFQWRAQTTLFAFKRGAHHQNPICLGTWEWGFKVTGGNIPEMMPLKEKPDTLWSKTRFLIDSLTHLNKN